MNTKLKEKVVANLRARNGNCSRIREALLPEIAGEDLWGHGGRSLVARRIGKQLGVPESTVSSVLYTSREYKDAVKSRIGTVPHAKNGRIGAELNGASLLPQANPANLPPTHPTIEETAALMAGDDDEPTRPKPPKPLSTTIKRTELEKLKEAAGRTAEAEELFFAAQAKVEELTAQVKRQEALIFGQNTQIITLKAATEKAKAAPAPREQNVEDSTRFLRAMPPREQCLALVGLFKLEALCKAARVATLLDGEAE